MNIAGTEYNLNHKSLEIYLSGCFSPHCKGCHNKELWDFNIGYDPFGSIFNSIMNKIDNDMVEKVWILGGEPLDQDRNELNRFLMCLWFYSNKDIWLWTRYTEIPDDVGQSLSYAKIGAYDENLPSYVDEEHGITLASSNQRIIKVDKSI
jgi:anaerobic ribonucleoside-triphosphate reductase activating protein